MSIEEAEELMKVAYAVEIMGKQLFLVFHTKEESDRATKALYELFGSDNLILFFICNDQAVDIHLIDTDKDEQLEINNLEYNTKGQLDWLKKQPSDIHNVTLFTAWKESNPGLQSGFRMSYFPGLDSAGIRNIEKLVFRFI